jgi:hypothetical protein
MSIYLSTLHVAMDRKERSRKVSRADIAEARRLVKVMHGTKILEDRLRHFLTKDSRAQSVFKKLLDKSIPQRHVIKFLEATSDPDLGKRLQQLVPRRDEGERLVQKMQDTAEEIRLFGKPGRIIFPSLPHRQVALRIADSLEEEARAFNEIRWPLIVKRLGFKGFWSQLPIAAICWKFDVPNLVTYTELSNLLGIASSVRRSFGQEALTAARNSPRALRQAYVRFRDRNDLFIRAGGLEVFVQLVTATIPE